MEKAGKYEADFCPNKEECYKILRDYKTPMHVINHCETVAAVSTAIGRELVSKGVRLNLDLIEASAYLHDIARTKKNHDKEGAAYLSGLGLHDVARVVCDHTFHRIKEDISSLDETDILSIADRTVIEDRFVGPRKRMRYITDKAVLKFGEERRDELEKRADAFVKLVERLEEFIGKKLEDIIPKDSKY